MGTWGQTGDRRGTDGGRTRQDGVRNTLWSQLQPHFKWMLRGEELKLPLPVSVWSWWRRSSCSRWSGWGWWRAWSLLSPAGTFLWSCSAGRGWWRPRSHRSSEPATQSCAPGGSLERTRPSGGRRRVRARWPRSEPGSRSCWGSRSARRSTCWWRRCRWRTAGWPAARRWAAGWLKTQTASLPWLQVILSWAAIWLHWGRGSRWRENREGER